MKAIRIPSWGEILDPAAPWGLILRSGGTGLWLLRQTAEEAGEVDARVVAGSVCSTSAGLFDEWAAALEQRDAFGGWDALHDRMIDIAGPCAMLVGDAERLLDDEPARLPSFLRTLRTAAEDAAAGGKIVRFVFQSRFEHDAGRLAVFHEHGVVDIL